MKCMLNHLYALYVLVNVCLNPHISSLSVSIYLSWYDVFHVQKMTQLSQKEFPPTMSVLDVLGFKKDFRSPSCQYLGMQHLSSVWSLLVNTLSPWFPFLMSVLSTNNGRLTLNYYLPLVSSCFFPSLSPYFWWMPSQVITVITVSLLKVHKYVIDNRWKQLQINQCLCNTFNPILILIKNIWKFCPVFTFKFQISGT